jgi:pimeloyl-ACP methyl ester carboxylesterase
VHRVSDLSAVGLVQIVETLSLLSWMQEHNPWHAEGQFGVCGISMGAEIATLFAAVSPIPCHLVAVMPSHSAVATWNDGIMHHVADWAHLADESTKEDVAGDGKVWSAEEARARAAQWLESTDIQKFPPPYIWLAEAEKPNMILVGAVDDQYIPRESVLTLARHWAGMCEVRWLAGGHCTGVVFHKETIRKCIVDAMKCHRHSGT